MREQVDFMTYDENKFGDLGFVPYSDRHGER